MSDEYYYFDLDARVVESNLIKKNKDKVWKKWTDDVSLKGR